MSVELCFEKITKYYGEKSLYQKISGTIPAGSCSCFIGNNGSGKSTMLKILAGLTKPTSGTVAMIKNNTTLSLEEFRQQIAMVSPEMQLYSMMTAMENLEFFAHLTGRLLTTDEYHQCLQTVQLLPHKHQLVKTFSTGMKQRLKLAVILAVDKPVWLLDEPSSNLDETGRQTVRKR